MGKLIQVGSEFKEEQPFRIDSWCKDGSVLELESLVSNLILNGSNAKG